MADQSREMYAEYSVDVVLPSQIPKPFEFRPSNQIRDIVSNLLPVNSANTRVSPLVIEAERPDDPVSIEDLGINIELLTSDARDQIGNKYRKVIRMGSSFDHRRAAASGPRELEALAVSTMGLDASLYSHGAEQARRMFRLFDMQQRALLYVFEDLLSVYGNSQHTLDTFDEARGILGESTPRDVKYGVLCGLKHDDGEAKIGADIPLEDKLDPRYAHMERAEATEMAQQIHVPYADQRLMELLKKRYMQDNNNGPRPTAEELAEIEGYLHPCEIVKSLHGTELQTNGNVFRGTAFHAVERVEYILSGIMALEAIEHNFNNAAQDPELTQKLLRLGVGTLHMSLAKLMEHAEKFVFVYDFLAQNQEFIDRYASIVTEDIYKRREDPEYVNPYFGIDPFSDYPEVAGESEKITREEAKERYLAVVDHWNEWRDKKHLVRSIWEAHFGTHHPLSEGVDISFMHRTARRRRGISSGIGEVIVEKGGLKDMFGVGLDPDEQTRHEDLFVNTVLGKGV